MKNGVKITETFGAERTGKDYPEGNTNQRLNVKRFNAIVGSIGQRIHLMKG